MYTSVTANVRCHIDFAVHRRLRDKPANISALWVTLIVCI